MELHDDFNQKLERVNQQLKSLTEAEKTQGNIEQFVKSLAEEVKKNRNVDRKYTFYDLTEREMTLSLHQEINTTRYIEKGK